MNVRQIMTRAVLTTMIGVAAHAQAGVLGGAVGGGLGGGFGGSLSGGGLGSAGNFGAAGEFYRPRLDTHAAKSAANKAADSTAGQANAAASAAPRTMVRAGEDAQSADTLGTHATAVEATALSASAINARNTTSEAVDSGKSQPRMSSGNGTPPKSTPAPKAAPQTSLSSSASAARSAPAMSLGGDSDDSVTTRRHSAGVEGGFDTEHSTGTNSAAVNGTTSTH